MRLRDYEARRGDTSRGSAYGRLTMGAWGKKTFQNDSALDWLSELAVGGPSGLRLALTYAANTESGDYLDSDDGQPALAAAEIVAAHHSGSRERLTAAASSWLEAHPDALTLDDVGLAHRAVCRVLAKNSELRALWAHDESWASSVRDLLARLGDTPPVRDGEK